MKKITTETTSDMMDNVNEITGRDVLWKRRFQTSPGNEFEVCSNSFWARSTTASLLRRAVKSLGEKAIAMLFYRCNKVTKNIETYNPIKLSQKQWSQKNRQKTIDC